MLARGGKAADRGRERLVELLHARIDELAVKRDFLSGVWSAQSGRGDKAEPEDATLALVRKRELADVNRSSLHCEPDASGQPAAALQSVVGRRRIEFPYYGTCHVSLHLRRGGHAVGRDLARSLMAAVNWRTGIRARASQTAPAMKLI